MKEHIAAVRNSMQTILNELELIKVELEKIEEE